MGGGGNKNIYKEMGVGKNQIKLHCVKFSKSELKNNVKEAEYLRPLKCLQKQAVLCKEYKVSCE